MSAAWKTGATRCHDGYSARSADTKHTAFKFVKNKFGGRLLHVRYERDMIISTG